MIVLRFGPWRARLHRLEIVDADSMEARQSLEMALAKFMTDTGASPSIPDPDMAVAKIAEELGAEIESADKPKFDPDVIY